MTDYQEGLMWGVILGWLFSSIVIILVLALFHGAGETDFIPDWRARRENQGLYQAEKNSGVAPRRWQG